jgi:predicted RNA-binding protein with PUA-like domain
MAPAKQYWLMKSEPTAFSIADLEANRTTYWSGVRNFQARNFMRDQMRVGDGVFFYHSSVEPIGIAGMSEVIKTGYPDFTAWDPKDEHYDPKSTPEHPVWFMVDIRFVRACQDVISLKRLKTIRGLHAMAVVQRGMRLSVQPVSADEWKIILGLPEWGSG